MDDYFNSDNLVENNSLNKKEELNNSSDNLCNNKDGFIINYDYVNNVDSEPVKKTTDSVQELFDWLDVFVTAIVSVVIIFSLLFRVATIDGPSMQKTLFTSDKVIITNLGYTPKVGDIVVVSRNIENSIDAEDRSELPIIKRVIAVAGQTVDIDFQKGTVKVDGVLKDEPYANTPTNKSYDIKFPVIVPDGCIFVMGDNRNDSLDSRSSMIGDNGMIDTRYVLGHAIVRVFPFNKIGRLK